MDSTELQTPLLLLAMPQVTDPFFYRSVILLLHHQDEGSIGFIVNRPTEVKIGDILDDLEIPWLGSEGALAFFGGPVEPQLGTLLYRPSEESSGKDSAKDSAEENPSEETEREVIPGVVLTQHIGDLKSLAEEPPSTLRLLLGYAGWGEGQLEEEILRHDWIVAPTREDLIFSDEPEEAWRQALDSVGVNPEQLPSFSQGDGGSAAN